jgi:hypothetical protein
MHPVSEITIIWKVSRKPTVGPAIDPSPRACILDLLSAGQVSSIQGRVTRIGMRAIIVHTFEGAESSYPTPS